MLERIQDLPTGIYGLKAIGRVDKQDYEQVVRPMLKQARRKGHRVRFLYQFGPDFIGFTAGGALEDMLVGLKYLRSFERCAVVTDKDWISGTARAVGMLMPCPVKVFRNDHRQEAVAWLSSSAAEETTGTA